MTAAFDLPGAPAHWSTSSWSSRSVTVQSCHLWSSCRPNVHVFLFCRKHCNCHAEHRCFKLSEPLAKHLDAAWNTVLQPHSGRYDKNASHLLIIQLWLNIGRRYAASCKLWFTALEHCFSNLDSSLHKRWWIWQATITSVRFVGVGGGGLTPIG